MRFVRVPPYESGVKLTNFVFSWQDGEFFWGKKCCTLFHTENEELSKKIGTCILGLGEISREDLNFTMKTCTVGIG